MDSCYILKHICRVQAIFRGRKIRKLLSLALEQSRKDFELIENCIQSNYPGYEYHGNLKTIQSTIDLDMLSDIYNGRYLFSCRNSDVSINTKPNAQNKDAIVKNKRTLLEDEAIWLENIIIERIKVYLKKNTN